MPTIALIGCSKLKRDPGHKQFLPARDLYDSDLFRKRVAHVESRGLPWYVISAQGGVIAPDTPIRTYDKTMSDLTELEIAEWHVGIANQVFTELYYTFGEPALKDVTIELHAGKRYCEPLATILSLFGIKVVRPVASLGIGQQLAYYGS